jgi:hypothetical protein
LCAVWEIDLGGFATVKSYKLIADTDFPDSIDPGELDKKPIALTIPSAVQPSYSKGNKNLTWFGVTEFHVSPDVNRGRLPSLLPWYGRIMRAAALKVQLSGTTAAISNFVILDRPDGIQGPMALQYGNEAAHWGFIVNWKVEESLNGSALPVSG